MDRERLRDAWRDRWMDGEKKGMEECKSTPAADVCSPNHSCLFLFRVIHNLSDRQRAQGRERTDRERGHKEREDRQRERGDREREGERKERCMNRERGDRKKEKEREGEMYEERGREREREDKRKEKEREEGEMYEGSI